MEQLKTHFQLRWVRDTILTTHSKNLGLIVKVIMSVKNDIMQIYLLSDLIPFMLHILFQEIATKLKILKSKTLIFSYSTAFS